VFRRRYEPEEKIERTFQPERRRTPLRIRSSERRKSSKRVTKIFPLPRKLKRVISTNVSLRTATFPAHLVVRPSVRPLVPLTLHQPSTDETLAFAARPWRSEQRESQSDVGTDMRGGCRGEDDGALVSRRRPREAGFGSEIPEESIERGREEGFSVASSLPPLRERCASETAPRHALRRERLRGEEEGKVRSCSPG